MDERLINLEKLKQRKQELQGIAQVERVKLANRVKEIFELYVNETGYKLHIPFDEFGLRVYEDYNFSDKTTSWRTESREFGFIGEDGKKVFAAGFDFWIDSKTGVNINRGTCGHYNKSDVYQVAINRLISRIWDFTSYFEEALERVNKEPFAELSDIRYEINKINTELKNEENIRKTEEITKLLDSSINKILYYTNKEILRDANYKATNKSKITLSKYAYKIIKITPKQVRLQDLSCKYSYTECVDKKDWLISRLKSNNIKIFDHEFTDDEIKNFSEIITED